MRLNDGLHEQRHLVAGWITGRRIASVSRGPANRGKPLREGPVIEPHIKSDKGGWNNAEERDRKDSFKTWREIKWCR